MKYIYLNETFYKRYPESQYPEILRKENRPFVQVVLSMDHQLWAIPLRSNISHEYAVWTNRDKRSGLDFSKAVPISARDIQGNAKPWLRQEDYDALRNKEYIVQQQFSKFIKMYRRAKEHPNRERYQNMLRFSSLQYFSKELGLKPVVTLTIHKRTTGQERSY